MKRYLVDVWSVIRVKGHIKTHSAWNVWLKCCNESSLLNAQGGGSHQTAWSEVTVVHSVEKKCTQRQPVVTSQYTRSEPNNMTNLSAYFVSVAHVTCLVSMVLYYIMMTHLTKRQFQISNLMSWMYNFGLPWISDWNYIFTLFGEKECLVLACAKALRLTINSDTLSLSVYAFSFW